MDVALSVGSQKLSCDRLFFLGLDVSLELSFSNTFRIHMNTLKLQLCSCVSLLGVMDNDHSMSQDHIRTIYYVKQLILIKPQKCPTIYNKLTLKNIAAAVSFFFCFGRCLWQRLKSLIPSSGVRFCALEMGRFSAWPSFPGVGGFRFTHKKKSMDRWDLPPFFQNILEFGFHIASFKIHWNMFRSSMKYFEKRQGGDDSKLSLP